MVLRLGLIISKGLLDPANKRLSSVNDIHWVWVNPFTNHFISIVPQGPENAFGF